MYRIADSHCDYLSYQTLGGCGGRVHDQMEFSDLIAGGLSLQNFAIWVPSESEDKRGDYNKQLTLLNSFINKHSDTLSLIKNKEDLNNQMQINVLLSVEGGESIDCSLKQMDKAFEDGAKVLSLTWNGENAFAHGAHSSGGIKKLGFEAIKRLSELGMALDVSHLNEQGFWEAAGAYEHALCATHSCVYELCEVPRNLKKDQIRHIINSRGYIGINFYTEFLKGRYAKLSDVLRHTEYILELGGENSVGFGSDFCGIQYTPDELKTAADFQKLPQAMELRGYSKTLIEKICYSNFYEFILKFL